VPRARAEQQFQRKVARRALGPLPALPAARVSLVVFEMWTEIYRAQPPKPVRTPPALPSKETSRAIALAYPLHGSIDDTTWRSVWWERSLFLWPGGNWGARRKGKPGLRHQSIRKQEGAPGEVGLEGFVPVIFLKDVVVPIQQILIVGGKFCP
jgi:hypothetical protein